MPQQLFEEYMKLPQVEAIALGGSRAGNSYDEKSDYDVYVYCTEPVPEKLRKSILTQYCSQIEIGNHFWEYEDNCTLKSGIDIDILYRDLDDFAKGIEAVVIAHQAYNGYTTCMWHNLITCKIIYDKDNRLHDLQGRFCIKYPPELKKNIIDRNMKLLRYGMPAYEVQIAKAVKRRDLVSINHRVTEFMASYFDILFAVNELTHPGEKRLIELCEKNCSRLPENFRMNLEQLFQDMYVNPQQVESDIDKIILNLIRILDEN